MSLVDRLWVLWLKYVPFGCLKTKDILKHLKKFKICRMVHGIPAASMPGAAAREHIARFKTFSQMTMFASCQLDVLNQGAHGGHFNTAFAGELDCLLCCPPFCCMSC